MLGRRRAGRGECQRQVPVKQPLAIDLFCGLGGWTDGLLAEGFHVVGFDIERHEYGAHRYQGQLVIQDVLTLHGSQFREAALLVASPPCQEFSYMAMPWKLAKAKAAAIRADTTGKMLADLTRLFDACFRIQAQASIAAGRHIPLIVENVRGAQPWVGRSRWCFGSFALWGDVPALMPIAKAFKSSGMNWSDRTKHGQDFTRIAGRQAMEGIKNGAGAAGWSGANDHPLRQHSSGDRRRKEASAMIAKIPLPLSRHIAATFRPRAADSRAALQPIQ
jgi:hypothetical protein